MDTIIHDLHLEKMFKKICREKPAVSHVNQFREYTDRQKAIEFLINKLDDYLHMVQESNKWNSDLESGAIQTCRLLGEFKAPESVWYLTEILDDVIYDPSTIIFNASFLALEQIGSPALEEVFEKYESSLDNVHDQNIWLNILVLLGVTDDRITDALKRHFLMSPSDAVNYMADYGDKEFLPYAENYVKKVAEYLNLHQIDPFEVGARLSDTLVGVYIDNRESLVLLKEQIDIDHPEFDRKVESLDRELLKFADFDSHKIRQEEFYSKLEAYERAKPNDPCPCRSGKKFSRCCGLLKYS